MENKTFEFKMYLTLEQISALNKLLSMFKNHRSGIYGRLYNKFLLAIISSLNAEQIDSLKASIMDTKDELATR